MLRLLCVTLVVIQLQICEARLFKSSFLILLVEHYISWRSSLPGKMLACAAINLLAYTVYNLFFLAAS